MSTYAIVAVLTLSGGAVLAWYWRDRGKLARWLAVRLLTYSEELRRRPDLLRSWAHNVGYDEEGRCSMR